MWIHKKTGKKYEVVSEKAKMKLPSGEWVESVIYKPLYKNEVELFTREKKSFYEDFLSPKEQMEEAIKQWNNCDGHEFEFVEESYGGNFDIYQCKKCGKIEWRK